MLDRTRRDNGRRAIASGKAIHIEELDADPHNPFATDEPSSNRWLLITGVAGLAGAVVIGSTLMGFLGKERGGDQAPASVNPADFWQRTEVKGNYNGEIAEAAVALRPYSEVTVAYRPDAKRARRQGRGNSCPRAIGIDRRPVPQCERRRSALWGRRQDDGSRAERADRFARSHQYHHHRQDTSAGARGRENQTWQERGPGRPIDRPRGHHRVGPRPGSGNRARLPAKASQGRSGLRGHARQTPGLLR